MSNVMEHNLERTLPANTDDERSVLGGMLLDAKAYAEAAARGLAASDSSHDSHRRIYLTIQQMVEAGSDLDLVTTGIRPGETWASGGRTGDGKTSLALQIAAANSGRGVAVGYFSIEMSKGELLQRLWSHEGRIPFGVIRNPRCASADMRSQVLRAMTTVGRWPLFVAKEGS